MILHVITMLDPGGAENALLDLARGLNRRGWNQRVVHLRGDGRLAPAFLDLGIGVDKAPLEGPGDLFSCRDRLMSLSRDADLVHSHLLKANTLAALAAGPRPLVGSRHNDEAILERWPVRAVHRLLSGREWRHIAISEAVRDFYVEQGLSPGKFQVIPYGFDPVGPCPPVDFHEEFGVPQGAPRLLHAGRLVEQKGQRFLLEALAAWPEAHLVICGEGPLETTLRQQVHERGLDERVRFAGFRNDLAACMAGADIFVLPSLWEGLGRVLLEAMDAGLPVVASRTSAIPGVLGDTGFLSAPGDAGDLLRALEEAWAAREARDGRARSMARRLQDRFSMKVMLDRHEDLYREMLGA